MSKGKTIMSIGDYTGIMSQPYKDAGYNVIRIDTKLGQDVRLLEYQGPCHGIICQPPCTHLAGSGARWWKEKGESALLEAMAVVDACFRQIAVCKPTWWVLENPVGRLSRYLGKPVFTFHPHEFAKLADKPEDEAYTKRTCLWGRFTPPTPLFIGQGASTPPILGSKMHKLPPSPDRRELRSKAPQGFARAFFRCNP